MKNPNIAVYIGIVSLWRFVVGLPAMEFVYQHQVKLLIQCIETLNQLHEFDNIILYLIPDEIYKVPGNKDLLAESHPYIHKSVKDMITESMFTSQLLQKPIVAFCIKPWDYVNSTKIIPNLGPILNNNRNLAVVVLNDIFDADVVEFVAISMGASMKTKLVFLLIGQVLTDAVTIIRVKKLKRFFRWCWSKNMLDVILLFQKDKVSDIQLLSLEVYTYTPFPKPIQLIQITYERTRDYFVDRTSDLKGYQFKTPVYHDKPSVFKAYNPRLGRDIVTGISGHLYMEFVKRINGSFTELPEEPRNPIMVAYQNDLLVARNIDIGIHPFSYILPNNFYGSYPITNTNSCVVVPVIPDIFAGLYITRTLNLDMWLLLFLMFVVFKIIYMVIDKLTYGQWEFWNAFSITLRGMLNMALGNINHGITFSHLPTIQKSLIQMLLILTGMLYSQIYMAALSSFLSTTLYGKQLETLEDLQQANISIMILDYLYYAYNYLSVIPSEFVSSVLIADVDTVSKHLNSMNTSYAYIVYNEEWKVLQSLQQNLWKPRFRIASKLCIPNVYLSLPLQFNSPFYYPLQKFILTIQATGLEQIWNDKVLWDIRHAATTNGSVQLTENYEHPAPLTLDHFTSMWCIYAVGITLSLAAFLGESARTGNV